jgi:hypothetical protein
LEAQLTEGEEEEEEEEEASMMEKLNLEAEFVAKCGLAEIVNMCARERSGFRRANQKADGAGETL